MKYFPGFFLLLLSCVILSCKNQSDAEEVIGTPDAGKDSMFVYPISQYIEAQIAYVDTMPLAIEKHVYVNNVRIDSTIIDRQELRRLAADFIQPDLAANHLFKKYNLSQFHDQTINTLTFSYSAISGDEELQQKDVLLDPETQRVKNVMFRKVQQHGDTLISINGLWKHRMNFQLNYIIEPKNGPMQTRQIKVIWDRPLPSSIE